MKSSKRKISLAVAFVVTGFGAVAAAQAAPLLGGGSTLVQPTITVEGTGVLSYWGVGSGLGQTAFLNNDATKFTSVVTGTTLTASGTVDFANSDAPLSAAQISAYASSTVGQSSGALIQIPYITTPITIPLVHAPAGNGPAFTNDPSNTPTVALNDADLCGIFSGAISDWKDVQNPDTGSNYPAGAITVIYRSDNSGTTDLLTAHLAQVCPAPIGQVTKFIETQNFASLFPSSQPPANFKSASGSGGVAGLLLAQSGAAIGYLSPDYTNKFLAPSSTTAQQNNLSVASLRLAGTTTDVLPTFANASLAVGTVAAPTTLVRARVQTNWVPAASNPTAGYPISGTSQIIVSQCYADSTAASAVVNFLKTHYNSNAALLNGNGFATVPSSYLTAIGADFLSNTSGFNLDIGNTSVCTVTGR
ncbi:substrate-binding domain-containing protein [Paraburkholderia humisilvae]|uniref:Alkaline phosphatase L n=1 Tax=Paraburkholderia humisilvae TaxID=627669 RepID=A0A6J5F260_9BURK|nr:substrate-binding domain-containing protein [Paraburkholderia humisilvae]CAB3772454.1 Alkaline phosphatase L [Paraburkholderia humisilvae]